MAIDVERARGWTCGSCMKSPNNVARHCVNKGAQPQGAIIAGMYSG